MSPSSISHARAPGGVIIRIRGVMDETFDTETFVSSSKGLVALVDLNAVSRVTSFGVREWINALKRLDATYVGYVRCRPNIVSQFNMVSGFAGKGELLSLYLPFHCAQCGKGQEVLVDAVASHAALKAQRVPDSPCRSCSKPLEFDDLPETYFRYLSALSSPPSPPAEVRWMVSHFIENEQGAKEPRPFRIDKTVEGEVTALSLEGDLDKALVLRRLEEGLEGHVHVNLEGLGRISDEGFAGLQRFLSSYEGPRYLAGVGQELLGRFKENPSSLGGAKLLSVAASFRCAAGHQTYGLFSLEAQPRRCPQCMEPAQAEGAEALLRPLSLSPLSPQIQAWANLKGQAVVLEPTLAKNRSGERFGPYLVLGKIGQGGMAEVSLALQTSVGGFEKHLVLKRVLPEFSKDEAFINMLFREARLLARINHPNVVQIFDVAEHDGRFYLAMEYVQGWDLQTLIQAATKLKRAWTWPLAIRIVMDLCAGLHAAHTCIDLDGKLAPVIHRDVSPHNVLVSADGRVKVTDFGIAKGGDTSERTPFESMKGKISYMAPEQIRGESGLHPRMDIFPAGVILWSLLTLEHPFRRTNDAATMLAILKAQLPALNLKASNIPPNLEEVIARALAKEFEDRFQSAQEFSDALQSILQEQNEIPDHHAVAAFHWGLMGKAVG